MRCLSIRQPWAWLICAGKKTIENRVWQTPYRGTIAIHASTTKSEVSRLRKSLDTDAFSQNDFQYGAIIGFADIVDIQPYGPEHEYDGFACGPYCFQMANGRFLREPVPMLGKLNLFVLDPAIAAKIEGAETYQVDLNSNSPEARIANSFLFPPEIVDRMEQLYGKASNETDETLYEMCTQLIERQPMLGHGYYWRLKVGTRLGKDVSTDIEHLLKIWPDDLESMALASDSYFSSGKYVEAKSVLVKLLSLFPEMSRARSILGQALYELGEFVEAENQLNQALTDPDLRKEDAAWVHLTLAQIYSQTERIFEAKQHLDLSVEKNLEHIITNLVRARIAYANGQKQLALSELDKALAGPDWPEAQELKAKWTAIPNAC